MARFDRGGRRFTDLTRDASQRLTGTSDPVLDASATQSDISAEADWLRMLLVNSLPARGPVVGRWSIGIVVRPADSDHMGTAKQRAAKVRAGRSGIEGRIRGAANGSQALH